VRWEVLVNLLGMNQRYCSETEAVMLNILKSKQLGIAPPLYIGQLVCIFALYIYLEHVHPGVYAGEHIQRSKISEA
jgi:hypothetical protein